MRCAILDDEENGMITVLDVRARTSMNEGGEVLLAGEMT